MLHEPLRERARGRWVGILSALGVPSKALKNRHGPCPVCGGKDRFRFDDKEGTGSFYCSGCGPGDGIELVKRLHGVDFKEAAKLIEKHLGDSPVRFSATGGTAAHQQAEVAALLSRARPITMEDPVGAYLHARTGIFEFPSCLRIAPDERYVDAGRKPSWHPVMVAVVEPCDAARSEGQPNALHRTYLDHLGNKADVPSQRKMMGAMPTGAAVRLMPHRDVLGIAEGIETALSASILFKVPVWAALSDNLLENWVPPADVKTVLIYGDNDVSFAGQAASYALAKRLKAKRLAVSVELPVRPGADWNDVHLPEKISGAPAARQQHDTLRLNKIGTNALTRQAGGCHPVDLQYEERCDDDTCKGDGRQSRA